MLCLKLKRILNYKNDNDNLTSHNNIFQKEGNNTIHEMFTSLYNNQ